MDEESIRGCGAPGDLLLIHTTLLVGVDFALAELLLCGVEACDGVLAEFLSAGARELGRGNMRWKTEEESGRYGGTRRTLVEVILLATGGVALLCIRVHI